MFMSGDILLADEDTDPTRYDRSRPVCSKQRVATSDMRHLDVGASVG